jgi:hypothetical protein
MKKIFSFIILSLFVVHFGCDNDGGTGSGGFGGGGGGGGGGAVTFQVSTQQGQQGGINFQFKPSTNVTVTQVTASLPAQQFNDVIQGDGTTVFDTQNGFSIGEYQGVASGQQWTFNVQGKIGNAQGQTFNVNTNFTVP